MIKIHDKDYITVAERVQEAHKDEAFDSLYTEVLSNDPVVIKATVRVKKGDGVHEYTGISAANPLKAIEKQSPYEVAETSAVGRALGFAGYGIVAGIATADEIKKAEAPDNTDFQEAPYTKPWRCELCGTNFVNAHKPGCPNKK